jgi:phosphoribosylformylglycinamidine synthase
MIGVLDNVEKHVRSGFRDPFDAIILLGMNTDEIGGSEYLKVVHGKVAGDPPAVSLAAERALQVAMITIADERLAHSAHDCAEGGLAVAVAECCIMNEERLIGAQVRLHDELPPAALFFGEAQGRIVLSCAAGNAERIFKIARKHGVPARRIGTVGSVGGVLSMTGAAATIEVPVAKLSEVWRDAIPRLMERAHTVE